MVPSIFVPSPRLYIPIAYGVAKQLTTGRSLIQGLSRKLTLRHRHSGGLALEYLSNIAQYQHPQNRRLIHPARLGKRSC